MNKANSNRKRHSIQALSSAVLLLGLLCGGASVVSAAPILPGFDGLVTPASAGSNVDTPFGNVLLEGVPLPGLQGVDTIVARKENGPPEGAILPLGGAMGFKGFGLSVMIDVFGGILAGSGVCRDDLPRGANGVWMYFLDVEKFIAPGEYDALME